MHSFIHRWIWTCAFALVLGLSPTLFGQGVTSADINGFVMDSDGKPVAGAKVIALHVASGTQSSAVTNSRGEYDIDGLRPGGPYTVSVTASAGSDSQSDLYVDVGGRLRASFTFQSSIVKMEAVKVNTTADDTFDSGAMSLGTSFSSKDVGGVSTIRRDVQDLENLDPRANVMQVGTSDSQYTISFAGQNPRENLFLIDGVSATDNFGLNSNGYAGFRNPLPPEWIESITVDLSPYDVVFSGFQGGLLNATLKSGTNQFHGSLYDLYEGTNFRGADPVPSTILGSHEKIQAHTVGGTVSGPIIKDKLFFFVGYDTFRQISVPPVQNFVPDNSGGIYTQIINKTISSYGFNPGTFIATNHSWQQNFVGKLDWNISDSQKFEFTFRHTDGEAPNFYNYTNSFETSLSASWYNTHRTDQSYTIKLISDWSQFIPTLHTEIEGTYKRYNGTAQLNGPDAPAITIDNVPGTSLNGGTAPFSVFLGQYWAYQTNNIYTWEQEEHAYADYTIGNHTIKFGVSFDRTGYTDTFIPNTLGSYTFATVQDYLNGTPTYVQQAATYPGYTLSSAVSHYYSMDIAPLIGDTWRINDSLSVVAGVRMDYPYEPQNPPFSPLFFNAFGYRNNTTINGNETVSPRVGFTYLLPFKLKTQIRGGAGLFLGQNPVVWTENSFNNAGQLNTVNAGSTSSAATTAVVPGYTFTGPVPPPVNAAASTAVPAFDVTSPNFKAPSNWKENLAIDRELGFWNLIATADVDFSQVNEDAITREVNLKTAATGPAYMPDGAIHYNGNVTPGSLGAYNLSPLPTGGSTSTTSISSTTLSANPLIGPVYYLKNTTKGGAQEYTLQLRRPMVDGWSASIAWSHTHATAVDPSPSSTASGNYGDNPFVNPNDNIAYRSQYATPDKFVFTAAKQFKFFKVKNSMTTISGQYIAETGQPYSYTFKGDADGSGISNASLFYVPTGPNDPKVTWGSAAEETAFFQFLQNTPDLAKYAGKIVPRNGSYAPWEHFMNVHVEQQIPIYGTARLVAFWDCFDFGNLLNRNWGTITNYNGSFNLRTVAGTFLNNTTGQYIYTFNTATLGTPTEYPDMSRWTMQIGARLEF